jgi:hypothetical protein
MLPVITRRQREVLDYLSEKAAFSSEKAHMTASGLDSNVAEKLAQLGVLNKRYDAERGMVYWIRAESEPTTGTSVEAGFVVSLARDITTPSGRLENFFLARAPYDGTGTTFRRLLRGWTRTLGLTSKDLIRAWWNFKMIPADSAAFHGDHVIVETTTTGARRR